MSTNNEGTTTGRFSGTKPQKANSPKPGRGPASAQRLREPSPENGPTIFNVLDESAMPPHVEMCGMHLGPRNKREFPYSYDPLLVFSTGEVATDSVYSDRLLQWYGHDLVRAKMQRHFGESGDYYSHRSPEVIEAFLRDALRRPNLHLTRIEEHCNQASGFPVWYFAYQAA